MANYIILENINLFIISLFKTITIWLISSTISIIIGTLIGLCLSKYFIKNEIIKNFFEKITLILRGIPFYIQLSIFYFLLPSIFPFFDSSFLIGIFSLGICSSAYTSNIVKTLINDFDYNQYISAKILGYNNFNFFKYILFPQIFYKFLALIINELDSILKSTTILSTIGVFELTKFGFNIISRTMNPLPIYLFLGLIYFSFSSLLFFILKKLQSKNNKYLSWNIYEF